ncbi:hypothetical protein VTN00DRAFT_8471 [Thermoascus crustaceus]|uniref:uncharacterized protein n=1 Tax=Thermoascus crustaceus TaxID=5088 RepID=UPI00374208EE
MARESTAIEEGPSGERRRVSILRDSRNQDGELPEEWEMTYKQFDELIEQDRKALYEAILHTFNTVLDDHDELQKKVKGLELELSTLKNDTNEEIAEKDEQISRLAAKCEDYKEQIVQMVMQRGAGSVHGTPAPEAFRKSTKLPDPPLLTDGKDPKFEDWLSKMKNKLAVNADHYPSEELRMAYVENRVGGKASDHLAPRLRDEAPNRYQTADEIFAHLKTIYLDPNRIVNAKFKFRNLQMTPSDCYHDFVTEFLHLAGEAQIPETEYKKELYHKLTWKLQELTISERISPRPFKEFSTYCSQVANSLRLIQEN